MKREKGMMKENQKQRHQQKTNTTNKNTDNVTRTMVKDSGTYCTRTIQSLKMIERDLLSREKAKNIKQFSLSF